MSNNRKQKIYSFLNSLTKKELDDYLKKQNINKDKITTMELISRFKASKNETNHHVKISNKIQQSALNNLSDMYLLGEAYIMAIILYYGLQKDFNVKDFVNFINKNLNDNKKLKEYVYDIMKDFD